MLELNDFTETLRAVLQIVKTSPVPMSKEEIMSYFKDMELTTEQEELVINYLLLPHDEEVSDTVESHDGLQEGDAAVESHDGLQEGDAAVESHDGLQEADDAVDDAVDIDESEDSKSLRMYLDDVKRIRAYPDNEVKMQYVRLLSGDEKSIGIISDAWLGRIVSMSEKFFSENCRTEDIIQEGNLALLIRLRELCGTKNAVDVEEELKNAVNDAMYDYVSDDYRKGNV